MLNMARNFEELPLTLTVEQVGELLGVSRNVAYKLARRRDFPSLRIGKHRIVVPRDHFLRWINENAKRPID